MEQRITIRLSRQLASRLEQAAKRTERKRSDVVRLALERFLATDMDAKPIDRVRDLIGRVESGVPDLGMGHREHLIKRIRNGR